MYTIFATLMVQSDRAPPCGALTRIWLAPLLLYKTSAQLGMLDSCWNWNWSRDDATNDACPGMSIR